MAALYYLTIDLDAACRVKRGMLTRYDPDGGTERWRIPVGPFDDADSVIKTGLDWLRKMEEPTD